MLKAYSGVVIVNINILVMFETGAIQFFKKLDIGTFDLGDFLGNVLARFLLSIFFF